MKTMSYAAPTSNPPTTVRREDNLFNWLFAGAAARWSFTWRTLLAERDLSGSERGDGDDRYAVGTVVAIAADGGDDDQLRRLAYSGGVDSGAQL